MGLREAIKSFFKRIPFSGSSSGNFPFGNNFEIWNAFTSDSNQSLDLSRDVGDLRDSSIVTAGVTWVGRSLASARPTVIDIGADMKEKEVQGHQLPELLKRPNPYYAFGTLCKGIAFSWLTYATAYVLKTRNGIGQPSELWYEPHWSIRPVWPENGSEFITRYEVERRGIWYPVKKEDVIVLRDGIDMSTRCGMSATSALVRDYYTDKQAAQFTAQLLKNGLVPPIIVSLGDKDYPFTGNIEEFNSALKRKMSGNKAGEPMSVAGNVRAEKLGFDYSSIGLRDLRQVPQMAFCSAMGISPTSLYFDTSRKESTFANVEQFLKHDYRSYIVPLHSYIADEFTWNLLPEFDTTENRRVSWDYSQVAIMQPDQSAIAVSAVSLFEKDVLKRSEAREMIGYKWGPEDEIYNSEIVAKKMASVIPPEDELDEDDETKAANVPKGELDVSADFWRKHSALDKTQKALIDATEFKVS